MKKLLIATYLSALSLNSFGQLQEIGQAMQPYLGTNQRVYHMQDSMREHLPAAQRIEILNLHAYIDLSHLDPELVKLLEKQFAEAVRQHKVHEFWMAFSAGAHQAQAIIAQAGQLNPQVCEVIKAATAVGGDRISSAGFALGVQSRAPFCFVKDYFAKLQGVSNNLTALKKALFNVKLKVTNLEPSEIQTQSMYNEVAEKTKAAYLAQLEIAQKDLTSALALDEATLQKVKSAADALSTYISCPQLVSRQGETFICDVKVAPAPAQITLGEAYKILFKNKQTGAFQEQLLMGSLLRAANVFKTEFRPNDLFVDYMVDNLRKELSNLDYLIEIKLNKAKTISLRNLSDGFETLAIAQTVALRRLISDGDREKLLADLFAFKLSIEDYEMWNGSGFDQAILNKLKSQYETVLALYGEINLTLNLPKKDLLLDLGSDIELISLSLPNSQIGPVFLLGKNQKEIDQWMEFLSLN